VEEHGPLPPGRAIHILRQLCESLEEAHASGLVHRDIKPANIFLCRYGEDHDFVKVLDFGIAKVVHAPTAETELTLTVPDLIHGTPAFIAPEQALGSADVDARADIYSTGCVAYWLLTGQLVFSANTPMRLLMAHAYTQAEPPSTRTEMPIPPDLDALVLSCLAKDRAVRPQSARDLLQRLDAIVLSSGWNETRARTRWNEHLPPAVG
jgi:serine/threonine-protein kinase